MAQIKIYGKAAHLNSCKQALSNTLHGCVVDVLGLPLEKRFHRFFLLADEDFIYPADRSEKYTILEIDLFSGREQATKKALICTIFQRFNDQLGIEPQDVEITLHESPQENWGIRGLPGDELSLHYKVEK